jgi:MoxR-vWA-beta-propeller ternary system domain bpX2
MGKDVANNITYYLAIDESKKDDLAAIRPWSNLKLGKEGACIWIKDFDYAQVHSLEVKSIPYKTIYYEKNSKLYLLDSLLPDCAIPNVLWTAMDRAIAIKLPAFNYNYFGVSEKIGVTLVPFYEEQEATMMLTTVAALQHYIETAPRIRLENLKWTILNNDKVCILGKPLLPIKGDVYWNIQQMLLPVGYHFEFPLLASEINAMVNPNNEFLVIWNKDHTYALIDKNDFESLSISAVRLSIIKHPLHI